MMSNQNWYMGDFFKSFVWLSMDNEDNFKNNYLIFKPNYFIFFLYNYSLFLLTFIIIVSRLP
jgi:hypothetical protein